MGTPDNLKPFTWRSHPTLRVLDRAVDVAVNNHPSHTISREELAVVADLSTRIISNSARPAVTRAAVEKRVRSWVESDYAGDRQVRQRLNRYADQLAALRSVGSSPTPTVDTRSLARALVQSLPTADFGGDEEPSAKSTLVTAVKPMGLVLLAEFGLLNLFQLGASSGAPTWKKRLELERRNGGTAQLGWHPAELHPKSAYITPSGTASYAGYRGQYGDVLLEYRNEVRDRATFTNGDSLDGMKARPMRAKMALAMALEHTQRRPIEYTEGQIWGPTTGEDLAAVYVPRSTAESFLVCLTELQARFGVRVYTYEPSSDDFMFKPTQVRELQLPEHTPAPYDHTPSTLAARYRAAPATSPLRGAIAFALGQSTHPGARRAILDLLQDFPAPIRRLSERQLVLDRDLRDTLLLRQALHARARTWDFVRRWGQERGWSQEAVQSLLVT